ncbi:MAG: glycoside hydrolase family 3 C-terminal domain-containing protein [Rhizomicrobium sp.]
MLLKNDGTLPLSKSVKTLAVIGPNAVGTHLGGYSSVPRHTVDILSGIKAKLGAGVNVLYSEGARITESSEWGADEVKLADPAENAQRIQDAVRVARNADVIVLVIGDTEQTSREAWANNHLGDRDSLDLVGQQDDLANAIFALGKPVVVVLINGRPLSVVNVAAKANALVEGWYLGQNTGTAMADILFGDANPGGKLPVTIARGVGQLPMFYNYKPSAHRGYLFDTVAPLFPFGFGLSYTTFDISAPRLSADTIRPDGSVTVSVDVKNTGTRAGDQVVQLYLHQQVASVTRPVKELKGFQRVALAPGESKTLTFTVGTHELRMFDENMKRVVEPGAFDIMVGGQFHRPQDRRADGQELGDGGDRVRPGHRHLPGAEFRHAPNRDRGRRHRPGRRDAERARAQRRDLSHRSRHPLPDRARRAPHRGHLAISLSRRVLAARAGDDVGHRRGGYRAVGHQGEGRRPAALSIARRRQPRRRDGLLPRQRHDHRRDRRGGAQIPGAGLQGDPPAIGRSRPRLDLRRRQRRQALRAGRRRPPDENLWSTEKYLRAVPDLFAAGREALGDDVHLLHDVHHRLTPIEAGRLGKDLERYRLFWLEDAVPAENQAGFRLIRQHTTTPLAVGEIFNSIWDCKQLIEEQLIDYIRATVVHAGGITHLRRIASLADLHHVRTGCHGATDLSPVCMAAALHFDLSVPNFGVQELMHHSAETDAVFRMPTASRTA